MLFGGSSRGGAAASAGLMLVRHFSRKRAEDVRRIKPRVPVEEAKAVSRGLYDIIKSHGPLTVANTWNHVKEAGINGLNSKTHMKIMLKWMRGRKKLKLYCTHVGSSSKKFLYTILPEQSKPLQEDSSSAPISETAKHLVQNKKQIKKHTK